MKSRPWRNSPVGPRKERMGEKVDRLAKSLKDFFVGIAYFEIGQTARQEKLVWQDLFMLLTFGDLLGVPILPPYSSLRILPHVLPGMDPWKKRMLRERDLTEVISL
jgi:hypothetical protein